MSVHSYYYEQLVYSSQQRQSFRVLNNKYLSRECDWLAARLRVIATRVKMAINDNHIPLPVFDQFLSNLLILYRKAGSFRRTQTSKTKPSSPKSLKTARSPSIQPFNWLHKTSALQLFYVAAFVRYTKTRLIRLLRRSPCLLLRLRRNPCINHYRLIFRPINRQDFCFFSFINRSPSFYILYRVCVKPNSLNFFFYYSDYWIWNWRSHKPCQFCSCCRPRTSYSWGL